MCVAHTGLLALARLTRVTWKGGLGGLVIVLVEEQVVVIVHTNEVL
jgi:hypothetical protein